MAQIWTVIGVMAAGFAAMIGFSYRAMTEQSKTVLARMNGFCGEINARMDGLRGEVTAQIHGLRDQFGAQLGGLRGEFTSLRGEFDGLRSEVHAQIGGLREMSARFDHLAARVERVESIDRAAHSVPIRVMGRETSPEN